MQLRIPAAIFAATVLLGLSGCATDGYGYGRLGYGSSYYGGSPYWGWYDDYYYPGTGYYIYDRYGSRHRWNDGHRRYWEGRRGRLTDRERRDNWRDYRADRRQDNRQFRAERRENRQDFQSGRINREQFRAERRELRRENRWEMRDDRRALRRENRRDRRD